MPARTVSVNLLEKDQLTESPIGRIITWASTYGRYIMISTEIIVLLAFISRFSLDRKLTDLNESITQKQAIIEANQPFEKEVIRIQKEITRIKVLTTAQNKPVEILSILKSILPPGVYVDNINFTPIQLSLNVTASTTDSFTVFIKNMKQTKQFFKIIISDIKKEPLKGIQFRATVNLNPVVQTRTSGTAGSKNNSNL
jgi:Tfp pilus assembly protein PilN